MRFSIIIVLLLASINALAEQKESPGQSTYEKFCAICHRDGLVGAPKFRSVPDWKSRTAQKDLEELVNSAIQGVNAMPAKGTCVECSEEDIKNAIQYMLPQS